MRSSAFLFGAALFILAVNSFPLPDGTPSTTTTSEPVEVANAGVSNPSPDSEADISSKPADTAVEVDASEPRQWGHPGRDHGEFNHYKGGHWKKKAWKLGQTMSQAWNSKNSDKWQGDHQYRWDLKNHPGWMVGKHQDFASWIKHHWNDDEGKEFWKYYQKHQDDHPMTEIAT